MQGGYVLGVLWGCSGVNGQIRPRLDLHKNVAGSKDTRGVHLAPFLMHWFRAVSHTTTTRVACGCLGTSPVFGVELKPRRSSKYNLFVNWINMIGWWLLSDCLSTVYHPSFCQFPEPCPAFFSTTTCPSSTTHPPHRHCLLQHRRFISLWVFSTSRCHCSLCPTVTD